MLLPALSPVAGAALSFRDVVGRHSEAEPLFSFLDLSEQRGGCSGSEQVPHVSRDGIVGAVLSTVVLTEAELRAGIAALGGADGIGERCDCPIARGAVLGMVHGEIEKLGAAGDAEFVKDAEEIILDGVRAKAESGGDFAIGHAAGEVLNDLPLAFGE